MFRKPYTHLSVKTMFDDPSLTQQHLKKASDINYIINKYEKTGVIDNVKTNGRYIDCSASDYHEACNIALRAEESFMALPANVRKRFRNDPYELLSFLDDPGNRKEAEDLGLLVTRVKSDTQTSHQQEVKADDQRA